MARIRTIKPDFWTDEKLVECSTTARLLFIGALNFADDYGNLPRSSKKLKMQVLPADDVDVEALLRELIANGLMQEYCIGSETYLHIKGFTKHQKVDRPSVSTIPSPSFVECSTSTRESSPCKGRESKGMECKGREEEINNSFSAAPSDDLSNSDEKCPPHALDVPPQPEPNEPSAAKPAKQRASQLPKSWRPNDAHREKCSGCGLNADELAEEFTNYHLARGSTFVDWDRAFFTWIGNAKKFGARQPSKAGRPFSEPSNPSIAEAGLRVSARYQGKV